MGPGLGSRTGRIGTGRTGVTGTERTGSLGPGGPVGPGPGGPAGPGQGGLVGQFRSANPGLEFRSANPGFEVSQPWTQGHPYGHPIQGWPKIVKHRERHMTKINDLIIQEIQIGVCAHTCTLNYNFHFLTPSSFNGRSVFQVPGMDNQSL